MMIFNVKSFAFFCLVWGALCISCQAQENIQISTQTIPDYPVITAQAGISGAVNVRTAINKSGEVKSAVAVSGHPLLRKSCENSAKLWIFMPSNEEERTFAVVCNFSLVDTAKTQNKKILITEKKILSSHEVETKAILDDEIQDCCSKPSSAWQKIAYPFRRVGSFFKKMFS
ncbi:MAG: energy transducer TonB [Pyrinomonadaceae bacterium]